MHFGYHQVVETCLPKNQSHHVFLPVCKRKESQQVIFESENIRTNYFFRFQVGKDSSLVVCASDLEYSNYIQCSPLNSNSRGPTKFVLIMRCSNYDIV